MEDYSYVGSELALFAAAKNWKGYWASRVKRHIQGEVLEVGAGIGSNTKLLFDESVSIWTCLEPDPDLIKQLQMNLDHLASSNVRVLRGTLQNLDKSSRFDTILYIDVLEHIERDFDELLLAQAHLKPGGKLIVLSPAHQSLLTPFDKAIGHFRRYDKQMMRRLTPALLSPVRLEYLDSVGMLLSAANRLALRQSMPTKNQLIVWDRIVVPVSRCLDRCIGYSLGKTILAIWQLR